MKKCVLYKKLKKNTVECRACSHKCKIAENKQGICGVRENRKGNLFLLVYSLPCSVNIDPIEKKPLYHFMPGTKILSIGTVGCNFRCDFCQNFDISQESYFVGCGKHLSPNEVIRICKKEKLSSIAYTYNEPAVFFEYAYDTARLAHNKGIKNIYVSNGFETPQALKKISPYLDAANFDLKSFSDDFYKKFCGGRLQPVLDTIALAHKLKIWVEITTLIIPKYNDSKKELTAIAKFIASISKDIPWHISRFFPCYKMSNHFPTTPEKLIETYKIGRKAGLRYVYLGNFNSPEHENTYCPHCNKIMVKRSGYLTETYYNEYGKCQKCKTKINLVL